MSAFYLDFAKDVVYIEAADDIKRRRMQTVMYQVLVSLTKLLTPILPHTAEEIWPYLHQAEQYAYLASMPQVQEIAGADQLREQWSDFMKFRSEVQKALEEARNAKVIGKSMQASVTVYPTAQLADMLNGLHANIMQLLIVSDFKLEAAGTKAPAAATEFADGAIVVEHAAGDVCERCRMTTTTVGDDAQFPMLCARCSAIVRANYPEAVAEGLESKNK
jgi:isoleucyl-tRNA synthetase